MAVPQEIGCNKRCAGFQHAARVTIPHNTETSTIRMGHGHIRDPFSGSQTGQKYLVLILLQSAYAGGLHGFQGEQHSDDNSKAACFSAFLLQSGSKDGVNYPASIPIDAA